METCCGVAARPEAELVIPPFAQRAALVSWYPVFRLGGVSDATARGALHVSRERHATRLAVQVTQPFSGSLVVRSPEGRILLTEEASLEPGAILERRLGEGLPDRVASIELLAGSGARWFFHVSGAPGREDAPPAAPAAPLDEKLLRTAASLDAGEARSARKALAALPREDVGARYLQALAEDRAGRGPSALRELEGLGEGDPWAAAAGLLRTRILLRSRRAAEALDSALSVFVDDPSHAGASALLATAMRAGGDDPSGADRRLGWGAWLDPGHPWLLAEALFVARWRGDEKGLRRARQRLRRALGGRPWTALTVALHYLSMDRAQDALDLLLEYFATLASAEDGHPDAAWLAAECFDRLGLPDEAAHWQAIAPRCRVAPPWPSHPELEAILARHTAAAEGRAAACAQQGRSLFRYLVDALDAHFHGRPAPSLIA